MAFEYNNMFRNDLKMVLYHELCINLVFLPQVIILQTCSEFDLYYNNVMLLEVGIHSRQ